MHWSVVIACGVVACGGSVPKVDSYLTTCYLDDSQMQVARGDGSTLATQPDGCTFVFDETETHALVQLDGGGLATYVYLLTLDAAHTDSFDVVPWTLRETWDPTQKAGPMFKEFATTTTPPGSAMVGVMEWDNGGYGTKLHAMWASGASPGVITADPNHWWNGYNVSGTVKLTHGDLALTVAVAPSSAPPPSMPSMVKGTTMIAGSTMEVKPYCMGATPPIQSGNAACVVFQTCTTAPESCPADCMRCAEAVNGVRNCCVLDGLACSGDTPCCSGFCVNQICVDSATAAESQPGAQGGSGCQGSTGMCAKHIGDSCSSASECCAYVGSDGNAYPLDCTGTCCREDTFGCMNDAWCCTGLHCNGPPVGSYPATCTAP